MMFRKNDKIAEYVVTFLHKESVAAETYRVKDAKGITRFLKLIRTNRLSRFRTTDEGVPLEVDIAKRLNCRNLCRCVDSGSLLVGDELCAYIVSEFVSGETLSERIVRDGSRSRYEIIKIGERVLRALHYLHSLPTPVVHGGVTMQNVLMNLVEGPESLRLTGLGSAHYLGRPSGKPDIDTCNVFCLAPECFSGVGTVRSDLYAVGALLYQLFYGTLPWYVDLSHVAPTERVGVVLAEREKELRIPNMKDSDADEQLVNVILKALRQNPDDRFPTAIDFMKALRGEVHVERQPTKQKSLSGTDSQKVQKVQRKSGEGFAAIAGMDELKERMREEIIEPLNNPEECRRYGVTIPNGMLLYGPPGCGKTFFAKHFAEEVGFNFQCITPATLKSRYVNATQENIAKMFQEAEENAPTIIFIDEINELVPNRESDVHEMSRSAVNEMLAQMDRTGERGVFIIGATNYPHMIDPAILRAGRLDKKYYIGPPDHEARKALFMLCLKTRPYDFGLDYDELARLTEGYVSADIRLIVDDASRTAYRQKSKITMAQLTDAVRATRPSVTAAELARYERIRAEMEGGNRGGKKPRPRVGFI